MPSNVQMVSGQIAPIWTPIYDNCDRGSCRVSAADIVICTNFMQLLPPDKAAK
jgi:hypothetical protein